MSESPIASDILGIKPIAKAVEKIVCGTMDAAGAFLGRICLPAAEEFGLALKDRVSAWRQRNAVALLGKVEQKMAENSESEGLHAHPRIAMEIVEKGSWTDDSVVQDLWAGLLASACTEDGDDDSNLIFVKLLDGLTKLQARVLKFACEKAAKYVMLTGGLIQSRQFEVPFSKLQEVAEENDKHRLDRELDHLRALGLLEGGLHPDPAAEVRLTPSPLALHMYVRCQGSRKDPVEFFNADPSTAPGAAPTSPGTTPAAP